jgi:hypothetical protein
MKISSIVNTMRFSRTAGECFITRLPDEVLVDEIMLILSIEDVVALRRVCVDFPSLLLAQFLLSTRSTNFFTSLLISRLFGRQPYAI